MLRPITAKIRTREFSFLTSDWLNSEKTGGVENLSSLRKCLEDINQEGQWCFKRTHRAMAVFLKRFKEQLFTEVEVASSGYLARPPSGEVNYHY